MFNRTADWGRGSKEVRNEDVAVEGAEAVEARTTVGEGALPRLVRMVLVVVPRLVGV